MRAKAISARICMLFQGIAWYETVLATVFTTPLVIVSPGLDSTVGILFLPQNKKHKIKQGSFTMVQ